MYCLQRERGVQMCALTKTEAEGAREDLPHTDLVQEPTPKP